MSRFNSHYYRLPTQAEFLKSNRPKQLRGLYVHRRKGKVLRQHRLLSNVKPTQEQHRTVVREILTSPAPKLTRPTGSERALQLAAAHLHLAGAQFVGSSQTIRDQLMGGHVSQVERDKKED